MYQNSNSNNNPGIRYSWFILTQYTLNKYNRYHFQSITGSNPHLILLDSLNIHWIVENN